MQKHSENDMVRLRHIRDAAQKAVAFTRGYTRASLDENELLVYALVRAFTIIGEAASNITAEFQTAHPHVPWASMIGMRHRVVHAYFEVDLDIVWDTVTENLPALLGTLDAIIPAEDAD